MAAKSKEARSAEEQCTEVLEHASTGVTKQFPAEVEFQKKSHESL